MRASVLRNRAEFLHDGYRFSFLLSIALVHCCDRIACASAYCPTPPFEIPGGCLLQLTAAAYTFVEEKDVGGREATLLSFSLAQPGRVPA